MCLKSSTGQCLYNRRNQINLSIDINAKRFMSSRPESAATINMRNLMNYWTMTIFRCGWVENDSQIIDSLSSMCQCIEPIDHGSCNHNSHAHVKLQILHNNFRKRKLINIQMNCPMNIVKHIFDLNWVKQWHSLSTWFAFRISVIAGKKNVFRHRKWESGQNVTTIFERFNASNWYAYSLEKIHFGWSRCTEYIWIRWETGEARIESGIVYWVFA